MAINFAAASTAGLNNPGTEIITLVKDGSGNFINPPSYDKMRAYLSSGEVPMLFVTDEGGETGSLYQLADYSETENKIRFGNSANAIEFCAGCETPNVSPTGGGGGNKDWTLLYDGTITIEEAVRTITDSLLVPCNGMVDFVGYIKWTDNANTENANDNISITVGKASIGYGRLGDATNAGNSVFQATVTSSNTFFGRATATADLDFNIQNAQCGFSPIKQNPDYGNVIIDFFAKTYAGTITLQLYGR